MYLKIYADFEADNKISNSSKGSKTTKIYKQIPVFNGYRIESEPDHILKSDYYKSPLRYDNVVWFVNEVKKIENKMVFYFKNIKKDIITTKKDEDDYRKSNICRFCEKHIVSDKVRDHCHLTGKYRG